MANVIKTLYSDESKNDAIFPRTKFNAVSDANGNVLGSVAVLNANDVSTVGQVNAIAGYDGQVDSAILKNLSGVQVLPQASFDTIDTTNLIASGNNIFPYTATQDCFMTGTNSHGTATTIYVNNKTLCTLSRYDSFMIVPLKKGDVVDFNTGIQEAFIYGVRR